MPEGDTIHRLARAMAPRLVGARLSRVEWDRRDHPAFRDRVVASVSARGKHLLIGVGDAYFRTHLGLHGSWHSYPRGKPWKRPKWQASLVLETAEDAFVCFNAKEVDCIPSSRLPLHRPLEALGPDLLAASVDLEAVVARARKLRRCENLAKVLLDQRIACGVGNVYKSEVLFLTGHAPSKTLDRLSDAEVADVYREARKQLHANLGRPIRTTTNREPRLWVYGRAGRPCLRCGATIRLARLGRSRSTYWCPACQT